MTGNRDRARRVLAIRVVTVVAVSAAWEALARSGLLYEGVVPPLWAILSALWSELFSPELYRNLSVTLSEVGAGIVIAVALGVSSGILFGARRFLGKAAEPYVNALATTPKIVFLPVIMLAFGVGVESKVAIGALSGFFPIVLSTTAGMLRIRPVLIRVGRSFNASAWQMVSKIYLPSLLQPIVAGVRLGLGVTVIGVLLGEIKLSNAGLGFLANDYYNQYAIAQLYAVLIIVFFLAVLANSLMSLASDALDKAP